MTTCAWPHPPEEDVRDFALWWAAMLEYAMESSRSEDALVGDWEGLTALWDSCPPVVRNEVIRRLASSEESVRVRSDSRRGVAGLLKVAAYSDRLLRAAEVEVEAREALLAWANRWTAPKPDYPSVVRRLENAARGLRAVREAL